MTRLRVPSNLVILAQKNELIANLTAESGTLRSQALHYVLDHGLGLRSGGANISNGKDFCVNRFKPTSVLTFSVSENCSPNDSTTCLMFLAVISQKDDDKNCASVCGSVMNLEGEHLNKTCSPGLFHWRAAKDPEQPQGQPRTDDA